MQKLRAALNLIWLDELFVGHGIVTIGFLLFLRTLTDPSQVAALVAVGLISTQVCLITAWSTWSPERLEVRAGRLLWRMGWLYLALLLLAGLNEDRHLMLLWSLPLAMGCFVLATWLPAEVLRWFRWRRIQRGELPVPLPRFQFRLADVLRWTTLVCMLLAVMSRYRDEATGYLEDLGYVILIFFGVVASVPTGLVVTLLLWLTMGQRWTRARTIVTGLLATAGLIHSALAAYFGLDKDAPDNELWAAIWGLSAIGCSVTLVTAAILRFQGWRVARKPRQEKSAASPLASPES
ncbi:MAG: hypothetical protein ACKVP0_00900 [Pirellulaceae bacterium]